VTVQTVHIGGGGDPGLELLPRMANRHGLIAGATGTGKTVTLQVMAEQFSALGVPVFLADVKGDLSGLATPGKINDRIQARITRWSSGICTASRVIPCAPRFPTWGRCCSLHCWV